MLAAEFIWCYHMHLLLHWISLISIVPDGVPEARFYCLCTGQTRSPWKNPTAWLKASGRLRFFLYIFSAVVKIYNVLRGSRLKALALRLLYASGTVLSDSKFGCPFESQVWRNLGHRSCFDFDCSPFYLTLAPLNSGFNMYKTSLWL